MSHKTMKEEKTKDLNYYLSLKYPIQIFEEEGAYTATHPDLPGSASFGDTVEEAIAGLNENRRLWLEGRLSAGQTIPEPSSIEEYSGKFLLRISRSLHASLDREASQEGVSLNQYVATLLAERHAERRTERLLFELTRPRPDTSDVQESAWHETSGYSRYEGEQRTNLEDAGFFGLMRASRRTSKNEGKEKVVTISKKKEYA